MGRCQGKITLSLKASVKVTSSNLMTPGCGLLYSWVTQARCI